MTDVVVVDSGGEEESAGEAIAEAIDQAIEVEQSFDIGMLAGKLSALEEQVAMHDALINLHSHEGLVERGDLMDCEERMASRIDAVSEPVVEPEPEPMPEPEPEPSNDNSEPVNNDSAPKSRKKRKSFAERYYG